MHTTVALYPIAGFVASCVIRDTLTYRYPLQTGLGNLKPKIRPGNTRQESLPVYRSQQFFFLVVHPRRTAKMTTPRIPPPESPPPHPPSQVMALETGNVSSHEETAIPFTPFSPQHGAVTRFHPRGFPGSTADHRTPAIYGIYGAIRANVPPSLMTATPHLDNCYTWSPHAVTSPTTGMSTTSRARSSLAIRAPSVYRIESSNPIRGGFPMLFYSVSRQI